METLKRISLALVIIGAINWGLIGLFSFDLVAFLFNGQTSLLSRLTYTLVGLSGLYALSLFFTGLNAIDSEAMTDLDSPTYMSEFSDELTDPAEKNDDLNQKDK